jgi:hypothetical protein
MPSNVALKISYQFKLSQIMQKGCCRISWRNNSATFSFVRQKLIPILLNVNAIRVIVK